MWSIWGTNVWKCFPIRTEGGGICKLLLPHGSSSLSILIVMRPARASSAARALPRAGRARRVPTGTARLRTAPLRTAPHRTAPRRPARPHPTRPDRPPRSGARAARRRVPIEPLLLGAEPIKIRTFLLKGITITIEPLATNRWLLFHTNACLRLYVLHLFVANTCHSINRFGHLM